MKLAANAYGIGPSLYDFERDLWEEQEMRREAREAAFEKHFEMSCRFLYCDHEKKKGIEKIAEVMNEAMNNLYCKDKDCAKFEQALFICYCSNDRGAINTMRELIDGYIRAVIRKEWEHEQEAA